MCIVLITLMLKAVVGKISEINTFADEDNNKVPVMQPYFIVNHNAIIVH